MALILQQKKKKDSNIGFIKLSKKNKTLLTEYDGINIKP